MLFGTLRDGLVSHDPAFEAIVADRDRYGQALWLFGDSIFHGLALQRYPERWTLDEIREEPLWPFRSPAAMINLKLKGLGLLEEDETGIVLRGARVACYAGPCGQPEKTLKAAKRLNILIETKIIRPGDTLVFLDAGPHTSDPDLYEAQWHTMRRALKGSTGLTLLMCSAFENLVEDQRERIGEFAREQLMYAIQWPPGSNGRSHNDATRSAALAPEPGLGHTQFVDMAETIKAFKKEAEETYGAQVYLKDNVHLNVWGQMRLVATLLNIAWPELAGESNAATESLVQAEWKRLGYGVRRIDWSAESALALMRSAYGTGAGVAIRLEA